MVGYLFNALIVTLVGLIIAAVMNKHYQFGSIYKLSIYALTLPILIGGVLPLIKVIIPFYWVLQIALASIYLGLAFQNIDSNISENITVNASINLTDGNNTKQINIVNNKVSTNSSDNSNVTNENNTNSDNIVNNKKPEDITKPISSLKDENDPNNDINR